jgi:hypothetical protein
VVSDATQLSDADLLSDLVIVAMDAFNTLGQVIDESKHAKYNALFDEANRRLAAARPAQDAGEREDQRSPRLPTH